MVSHSRILPGLAHLPSRSGAWLAKAHRIDGQRLHRKLGRFVGVALGASLVVLLDDIRGLRLAALRAFFAAAFTLLVGARRFFLLLGTARRLHHARFLRVRNDNARRDE